MYGSNISFAYLFFGVLSKNTNGKKFLPWGVISPMHTKIGYYLTIAIINECFEFQNERLQIIRIRYNWTEFCFISIC